ncbi:MAG: 2-isopropylmalate synthase [Elusimicrobia bacterium]|nr:2-isopropylmalate synthase [Elusimicrobiota bacterium]
MVKNKKDTVVFFDTTLRDGEQSPGASMTFQEKLLVAQQLAAMNVDIIEAGFPISSEGDFESVKSIAQQIKGPVICGLCRANTKDITTCWNAIKYSKKPRIHTFIATSDLHIEKKLQKTRQQVFDMAVNAVKLAKSFCDDVEFSAEDASRSDVNYLCSIVEAVIEAGATTVNIPDTVGYSIPSEFGKLIATIKQNVKNIDKAVISVHCHNDLGLGVANSLAAVENGARQIECTINGIGERAGNAALEEIVMAIKTKPLFYPVNYNIKTKEIYKTSKLVSNLTGVVVQPNKAIVGVNAFAHESGIHQDGMLKDKRTYEIMSPQDVGVPESLLVLGKHSGRHAFFKRLKDLGYKLESNVMEDLFAKFKLLADKKKCVFDDDINSLVEQSVSGVQEVFTVDYVNVTSGVGVIPTATIRLVKTVKNKKEILQEAACGSGPVDAAYKAIDKITGIVVDLEDYTLRAVSSGEDAQGEVNVKVKYDGATYVGKGMSTDIVEASINAYIHAVNKIVIMHGGKK